MSADIRKGDLIKATRKAGPEQYVVGRVGQVGDHHTELDHRFTLTNHLWDWEVLERPVPEAEPELVEAVRDAYHTAASTQAGWKAVIKTVREFDVNKESK